MSRILIAACVVALFSTAAEAQTARRGKVHRMEINNGLSQSVRYFGTGLSVSDTATLRDFERLENELINARNLISLKSEYIASEQFLEPQRRLIQAQLYGRDITQTTAFDANFGGVGFYGRPFGRLGAPLTYPGFLYTNYAPAAFNVIASSQRTENLSLQNGVGYEGAVKDAMAKVMATQATPEYIASLERSFDRLVQRASASPTLRAQLGLSPDPERLERPKNGEVRPVAGDEAAVTLTLKNGDTLVGKKMTEKGDWIILERAKGAKVRVRASEVVRIEESGGVKGASD